MAQINERLDKYIESFSKMLRADTTTIPPDSRDTERFYRFQELLGEVFPHIIPLCEHEDFDGSMLLKWKGNASGKNPALFMYHHDVVASDPAQWSHPPFGAEIADGRLYARGALDTKCGLWGVLQAADELAAKGFVPDRDVYFVSTRNEESSGRGADAISSTLHERGIELDMTFDEGGFILYDPIGVADGTFAAVAVGEKIGLGVKFIARSAGGHAAMPGKNTPLTRLAKMMAEIDKHDPFPPVISDTTAQMLRCFGPYMRKFGFVAKHPKLFTPLLKKALPAASASAGALIKTTIVFTMGNGSPAGNVIPTEAWVVANVRVAPHQTPQECLDILRRIAARYDVEVECRPRDRGGHVADHNGEAFRILKNAVLQAYPQVDDVVPYISNTASDSSAYSRYCKQCLGLDPFLITKKQMGTIHGVDENIDLDTLVPGVDVFRSILKAL